MSTRDVGSAAAWSVLTKVVQIGVTVGAIALLTRGLGEDDYGDFVLYSTVAAFVAFLSTGGLFIQNARSRNETERHVYREQAVALAAATTGFGLVATSATFLALGWGATTAILLGISLFGAGSALNAVSRGQATASLRPIRLAIASLVPVTARMVAGVAATAVQFGAVASFLALGFVVLALSLIQFIRESRPVVPRFLRSGELRATYVVGLTGLVIQMIQRFDVLALGLLGHADRLGEYQVALAVSDVPVVAIGAGLTFLLPALTSLPEERRRGVERSSILATAALAVVVAGVTYIGLPSAIKALAGPTFEVETLTRLFLSLTTGMTLVRASVVLALQHSGQDRSLAIDSVVVIVMVALLNLITVPPYGPTGAAGSTLLVVCAWTILGAYRIRGSSG